MAYGGNVLTRINTSRNCVETSKGISVSFDECARLWEMITRWHTNGFEFERKGDSINAMGAIYYVHSYQNDILTAGCHQIAYPEMEYIAKELKLVA